MVAGFSIWEVKDLDEAVAWAKRAPNAMAGRSVIEIRPFYEAADLADFVTPEETGDAARRRARKARGRLILSPAGPPERIGKAPDRQRLDAGRLASDGFAALSRRGGRHAAPWLADRPSGLALGTAAPAQSRGGGVAPPCDRACMTGLVDRYLEALVRHDATGLPLNRDVKFTENTARLEVGTEGLWVAASRRRPARASTRSTSARAGGFLRGDEGARAAAGHRAAAQGRERQITEIEHVLARTIREDALRNLRTPRPEFTADVAPADRLPRERMVASPTATSRRSSTPTASSRRFPTTACGARTAARPRINRHPGAVAGARSARKAATMRWPTSARSAAATSSTPT
jgi:hypothetical protein